MGEAFCRESGKGCLQRGQRCAITSANERILQGIYKIRFHQRLSQAEDIINFCPIVSSVLPASEYYIRRCASSLRCIENMQPRTQPRHQRRNTIVRPLTRPSNMQLMTGLQNRVQLLRQPIEPKSYPFFPRGFQCFRRYRVCRDLQIVGINCIVWFLQICNSLTHDGTLIQKKRGLNCC